MGIWFDSMPTIVMMACLLWFQAIQGYFVGHQTSRPRLDGVVATTSSSLVASSSDRFKSAFHALTDNAQPISFEPMDSNSYGASHDDEESSMSRIVQAWKSRSFTSKEKAQISALLKNIIPHLSASDLSKVIQGLPSIKLPSRSKDMVVIADLLLERLEEINAEISGESLSQALIGLTRLGVKFMGSGKSHSSRSNDRVPGYIHALVRTVPDMSPSALSMTLWAIGKSGYVWDSLPLQVKRIISSAIIEKREHFNSNGIANTIHGLSKMRVGWSYLPPYVTLSLIDGLDRTLCDMNELETSNCISGLGRLGANWETLPEKMKDGLTSAFDRNINRLGPKGLSMSIHGLGRMNADIADLSPTFRSSILGSIFTIAPSLNAQEVANVIHGLGKMHASFIDGSTSDVSSFVLPKRVKKALLEAVQREAWQLSSQGVSNTVYGLAKLGVHWRGMFPQLKTTLLQAISREMPRMNEQEVANTIHSLGVMGVVWNTDIPGGNALAIKSAAVENFCDMPVEGVVMTVYGFGKMGLTWELWPDSLRNGLSMRLEEALRTASEAHLASLIHALASITMIWSQVSPKLRLAIEECIARSSWEKIDNAISKASSSSKKSQFAAELLKAESADTEASMTTSWGDKISSSFLSQMPSSTAAAMLLSLPALSVSNEFSVLKNKAQKHSKARSEILRAESKKPENDDSIHYIYSLNLLGLRWEELGFSSKLAIFRSLTLAFPKMNERGVSNSINALSSMGVKWKELAANFKITLISSLNRIADKTEQQGISMIIFALARMDVCWADDLPETLQSSLRKAINKQHQLGEHALSNIIYGLGKLDRKWTDLHPTVQKTLKAALVVCHINDECTVIGVTNTLYGLAKMQVDWSTLSSSLRLALTSDSLKILPEASDSQYSSLIFSLAKCNVKWDALTLTMRAAILSELRKRYITMNEQQLAVTLYGLGSMGVEWVSLSSSMQDGIAEAIQRLCKTTGRDQQVRTWRTGQDYTTRTSTTNSLLNAVQMQMTSDDSTFKPQGLSMVIIGLRKMNANWTLLPKKCVESLTELLAQLTEVMNSGQLANTLFGMSKLGMRWDHMKELLKRRIVHQISKVVFSSGNAQHISLTINALGSLGVRFGAVEKKSSVFMRSFYRAVQRVMKTGQAEEISALILGMGLMDCPWKSFPVSERQDIIDGLMRVYQNDESSESSSEPFTTVRRGDVDMEDEDFLFDESNNARRLANTMYGLSLMIFDCNDEKTTQELIPVHLSLLHAYDSLPQSEFSEADKEQVLIYTHILTTVMKIDLNKIDDHPYHYPLLLHNNNDAVTQPSKLQQSVVSTIKSSLRVRNEDLKVAEEYSSFGGAFPVDATVLEDGEPVAFVEVDGPHHFSEGQLRRKDQMKEVLYRSKHPCATFTRVSFDQVDHLGSGYVGREVANYITLSMRTCTIEPSDCCNKGKSVTVIKAKVHSTLASTLPEYFYIEGWVGRRALITLNQALDWKNLTHKTLWLNSPLADFVFADDEEDNS